MTVTSGLTATSLPTWRSARSAIIANTARALIACVGDSTTLGEGSDGDLKRFVKNQAWPALLAIDLTNAKVSAHANSFFGDGALFADFFGSDLRIAEVNPTEHDWGASTRFPTVGGYVVANIVSTSTITFTPDGPVDTVDVYDLTQAATSPFTIASSVTPTSITISPPATMGVTLRKSTASLPNGRQTINIAATIAGPADAGVFLVGVDAYNSAIKDAGIANLGWAASRTSDWVNADGPGAPLNALTALGAKLTFIDLGINDMTQKVPMETYRANMRILIETAMKIGDVVLIVPNRFLATIISDATQDGYDQVLYDLSTQYGIPLYDAGKALGTFAAAKAAGYMFDDVHPSAQGYAVMAQGLADLLLAN